jgi:hypothetical protein
MGDPRYPESSAYHEAGHIVIAAAQGLRLSRHGVHLDADGRGISYYEYRKPRRFWSAPSEIKREHTIIATLAGLVAQQKFYPDCSTLGASDDTELVDLLLSEIAEVEPLEGALSTAQIDLKQAADDLVERFWPAIESVAVTLWETPDTLRDFDDPESSWSALSREKRLSGARLVEILSTFGIHASIWDSKAIAD